MQECTTLRHGGFLVMQSGILVRSLWWRIRPVGTGEGIDIGAMTMVLPVPSQFPKSVLLAES